PTVMYSPRSGWSTLTSVPVAYSDLSSLISFIDRIGPHGMSTLLRMSMASNLVLVMVHFSIVEKISFSRGRRAGGLAWSGWSFHSGLPITSHTAPQTWAWVMK